MRFTQVTTPVWRTAKRAQLHTVVTCSKIGYGVEVFSRRATFPLRASTIRVLRLPVVGPENCGVTAIGEIEPYVYRPGIITVEILAPCIVQRNGICM